MDVLPITILSCIANTNYIFCGGTPFKTGLPPY